MRKWYEPPIPGWYVDHIAPAPTPKSPVKWGITRDSKLRAVIKAQYAFGQRMFQKYTMAAIGARHGISEKSVERIIRGKR